LNAKPSADNGYPDGVTLMTPVRANQVALLNNRERRLEELTGLYQRGELRWNKFSRKQNLRMEPPALAHA